MSTEAGAARRGLSMLLLVLLCMAAASRPGEAAEPRELILAIYSVPKEAYERSIIPSFQRYWRQRTGQEVRIRASYGASGAQARAIIGGFEADVAALSVEGDVEQIVKAAAISHDWRQTPHNGMVAASVVALGVRKGNPKGIKTWEDLARPGIQVLYPNPKTSGGAMWDIIAIYGAGLKQAERNASGKKVDQTAAAETAAGLLKRIQRNVKVMDKSGRESVTTFERGVGDVIVTYENELLPRIKSGRPYDIIVPAETVWIENPAAVIDRNADRHKVRDVAEAFVAFLHDKEAQTAFLNAGFRPIDQSQMTNARDRPAQLFTIHDLGGWDLVSAKLFGPKGLWTTAVEELARGK